MGCNVGKTDQTVRFVLGLVLLLGYFFGWFTGSAGGVALVLGIIFLVTAAIRFCPLYKLVGINTCKNG